MTRNDTKIVYNITRQLAGRKTNTTKPVKDKDGKIITSLKQQLERWKDHFAELLNGECIPDAPNLPPGDDLDVDTGPITKTEIIKALKKIKKASPRTRPNPTRDLKNQSRSYLHHL